MGGRGSKRGQGGAPERDAVFIRQRNTRCLAYIRETGCVWENCDLLHLFNRKVGTGQCCEREHPGLEHSKF